MSDIRAWLEAIGLGDLAAAFEAEQIAPEDLRFLSEDDFKELGLGMGPRKRIMAAIAEAAEVVAENAASEPRQSAERRQITVMFCDLVGSTALSEQLDPEDLRSLMQAYQRTAGEAIGRYEGHVAQYLGDGLMTYFGWPRAHEDDAERAVRAALEIVEAVKTIEPPLQVRVGIATGAVVVGETGGGDASVPKLAVGETPNIAARVQGLAEADGIVIAASTRRLVGGAFELEDTGAHSLKGIVDPVHAWAVTGVASTEGRFEAARGASLTPLVGRDAEIAMVLERWQRAKAGEGQAIMLSGEPGIGKSRLAHGLLERLGDESHIRLRYQCSPYYMNTALYPVIKHLERAAGFAMDSGDETRLDRMEAMLALGTDDVAGAAPLVAPLLSLPADRYPPLGLSPQKIRQSTLTVLTDQVIGLARARPVLMVFEDAHWIDPTTLDLLAMVIDSIGEARVLVLMTYRPEFTPPWPSYGHVATLNLDRLSRAHGAALIDGVATKNTLPEETVAQILAKADGIPLFVEQLTEAVLEDQAGQAPGLSIPATLRDALMARLDRLGSAKEVAQLAATIGRSVSYDLLAATAALEDTVLEDAVAALVAAGLVLRRGVAPGHSIEFRHALFQETARGSLLRSDRQRHHARIVESLESQFPARSESEPEFLAHHCSEAGLIESAADYWLAAGRLAMQRSAHVEAERHLRAGLASLAEMHDTPARKHREIALHNMLGVCLMPIRGFGVAEVAEIFSAAAALSREVDDSTGLFVALRGMGQYQMISGDLPTACEQVGHVLALAEELDDDGMIIEANHLGWSSLTFGGDLRAALRHAETGAALYRRERHHQLTHSYSGHDPGVCCRSFSAMAMWQLGRPDAAESLNREGEALARELAHPFTTTVVLWSSGLLAMLRRDVPRLREVGERMIDHCQDKGFSPFLPMGHVFVGGALAADGDLAEGAARMTEGIEGLAKSRTAYTVPTFHAWLAAVCQEQGDVARARAARADGVVMANDMGDVFMRPEFIRIDGELLRIEGKAADAEATFRQAIESAEGAHASSLALRATMSLARLWQDQGKGADAAEPLAAMLARFDEGFATADLREAKALLEALR